MSKLAQEVEPPKPKEPKVKKEQEIKKEVKDGI
jgi:hypothetical protein